MKSGVYKVQHLSSGKLYVGSSKDVYSRLRKHKEGLLRKSHHSIALQNAFNKYGESAFVFEPILLCPREELLRYEQLLMDEYKSYHRNHGYNIRKKAESNLGVPSAARKKAPIGKKFGRFTVICDVSQVGETTMWKLLCECGAVVIANAHSVKRGESRSCGCYQRDFQRQLKRHKHVAGEKYNRLTFLAPKEEGCSDSTKWLMRCDCGVEKYMVASRVARGSTKSCGCLVREMAAAKGRTHGMHGTLTHNSWEKIRARCYNKKNNRYTETGGRGIVMCDRWRDSFENFYADMGERPAGKQIFRKDINGNYTPENCVWRLPSEAMRNNRRSKIVEINEKSYNVKDAEKLLGIYRSSINQRSRDFNENYQQATDHFAKKKGLIK